MKSGIIAAETIFENIKNKKDLSEYEQKFKKSWVYKELHAARNVKPSFRWGLILGIIFTGLDQILFRGKLPLTLKHKHADHETLKPANQMKKINYPKPRSEEHTSEIQSLVNLVCRLLLEKKNKSLNSSHW